MRMRSTLDLGIRGVSVDSVLSTRLSTPTRRPTLSVPACPCPVGGLLEHRDHCVPSERQQRRGRTVGRPSTDVLPPRRDVAAPAPADRHGPVVTRAKQAPYREPFASQVSGPARRPSRPPPSRTAPFTEISPRVPGVSCPHLGVRRLSSGGGGTGTSDGWERVRARVRESGPVPRTPHLLRPRPRRQDPWTDVLDGKFRDVPTRRTVPGWGVGPRTTGVPSTDPRTFDGST